MRQIYSSATHMAPFSFGASTPSLDGDQIALWSPTAGYVQPGSGFISEWSAVSQQLYGTSHSFPETTTPGFECGPSVPQEVDWDPTAALWGTPEGALEAVANDLDLTHPDFAPWITPTPPLTDASSAASPWSTSAAWAGVVPSPPEASGTHSQDPVPLEGGLALPSPSQRDPTWLLDPNPFASTGNSYLATWGNAHGQLAPGYSEVPSNYNCAAIRNTSYLPGEWCPTGPFGADSSMAASIGGSLPKVNEITAPEITLGKRPRASGTDGNVGSGSLEVEDHDPRPRKKGKGFPKTQGILEVEWSLSMTQHKSATKNPKSGPNHKSKAVERGAGGHAATSAQGLYDRFPSGPSVQQELTGAIPWGLTWVEESAQGEEPQQMGGTGQQQQQVAQNGAEVEESEPLFPIPGSLRERYSKLLETTEADWERGAVNELRCRLCPHARFSTWEGFKRHCDTTRVHPWEIHICDHCGDYFGRSDSFMRHRRRRPRVCQKAVPERAEAKGRDIKRLHEAFKAQMMRCLEDGWDIGTPFFRVVKAKYPSSSKKEGEDTPSEYN